jgi:hypothetical protein
VWFPVPLLKLNIEQWPMQLVKSFGSPIFWKILVYSSYIAVVLWQPVCSSYCIQPGISWTNETHRNWVSCCSWKHFFGLITTMKVCSANQIADLLTKSLGKDQFIHLKSKMGLSNLHLPSWRGVLSQQLMHSCTWLNQIKMEWFCY